MKLSLPKPLTAFGRVSRSILIVTLLVGSLFPQIPGFPLSLIAGVFAGIGVAYELLRWLPKFHPAFLIAIFFALLALHAVYLAPQNSYGDDKLWRWITFTLVSAMAASLIRDRRTFQTLAFVWLLAASGLAVATLLGYDGGRSDAFGANPIWLGRALATGVIIAIWLWWKKLASAWLMFGLIALLGAALVATGSRGPLLGVIVAVAILALFAGRGRIWRIGLILVGGIVSAWAVQTLPFFAGSRFETMGSGASDSDATRQYYWEATLAVIARNPHGVGFGNWSIAAGNPRHLWPHNLFLEIFAELGIWLGVLTVIFVAVTLIRLLRQCSTNSLALPLLAIVCAEVVNVNVSGDLNARTFWFMLSLGLLATTNFVLDTPMRKKRFLRRKLANAATHRGHALNEERSAQGMRSA